MDQINNNEGKELNSFPSFKPLERMPTLLGLPIPVTVLGALSILVTTFLLAFLLGIYGLVIPIMILTTLFFLKKEYQENNLFFSQLQYRLKGYFVNKSSNSDFIHFKQNKMGSQDYASYFKLFEKK